MEVLLPLLITLPAPAWGMIMVSLSFSIAVVALNFMIAYGLQSPQMTAIAREELAALIFTAFILLFWGGSDEIFNAMSNGLLLSSLPPEFQQGISMGPPDVLTSNHINIALATTEILVNKLKDCYIDLYLYEALIGFLSTISFPLGSPLPAVNIISFSVAPFTGLAMLSNAHTMVVEAIGYLITVLWAKQFILIFARDAVPVLVLPLGLIFRAFPFYRRTGSSLIAISFAMYFVMPFAFILSNFLIFDIYQPPDFTYMPSTASFFGTDRNQKGPGGVEEQLMAGRKESDDILKAFSAPSAVEQATTGNSECAGNALWQLLCSFGNYLSSALSTVGGFIGTVWNTWRFMVGMTGDFFFSGFNNPLMPASASAGLFYFIIKEVTLVAPLMIIVMLVTVFEIIITITAFRSVSLAIGGEAELVGITKVV
ncbi:hypothetical protein H0O00_02605 [Candidatus Micrarchaeota archaeon]|nr:hypothetical protein [Candidatus Micrarchaeota archaeon]